jgi:hypothetical protein
MQATVTLSAADHTLCDVHFVGWYDYAYRIDVVASWENQGIMLCDPTGIGCGEYCKCNADKGCFLNGTTDASTSCIWCVRSQDSWNGFELTLKGKSHRRDVSLEWISD